MLILILRIFWSWNLVKKLIGDAALFFKVKKFNLKEQITVLKRYCVWKFVLLDLSFLLILFFQNPYRVFKKFIQKNFPNENFYAYGETPYTSMEKIVKECQISPMDVFLELGSGRAKNCFWLAHFVKCKVVGIERIGSFVKIANFLKKIFQYHNLSFIQGNFFQKDFCNYSVIYLYGSCLEDNEIKNLAIKFLHLNPMVKIITISYPLSDFNNQFVIKKSFEVEFTWGKTLCYLNTRK